jgi:hypothetical protein
MRAGFFCIVLCALLWPGAVSLQAQPFAVLSSPNIARWMYPHNASPGTRGNASVFAAFGGVPYNDTRWGQYLLGWNTTGNIPAGAGARNYLIRRVRVILTISSEGGQYAYDNALHDYRTYFLTNDPRYLPATNASGPVELYGVGFRGGFSAATFQQASTLFAVANGNDYTNRTAYAACYDTNGLLVDVSSNVGDDETHEVPHPFEVAPFGIGYNTNFAVGDLLPTGAQITFDLNLDDPLIYGYVQQGLNQGNLSFMVASLVFADYLTGSPNWPDFYTVFNQFITTDQYPVLAIEGTVVRPNLDTDADGLPDDWEQFYFGQLGLGATNSFARDGVSNYAKYIAGTNPTNSAANLQVLSVQTQSPATEIRFQSAPSRQYIIQTSADLQSWQSITNPTLIHSSAWLDKTGTHPVYPAPVYTAWRDTNTLNQQQFYRLLVQ